MNSDQNRAKYFKMTDGARAGKHTERQATKQAGGSGRRRLFTAAARRRLDISGGAAPAVSSLWRRPRRLHGSRRR